MPGKARSGHGMLTRAWVMLRGVVAERAPERDERPRAARHGDVGDVRPPSLDEVLRDAAQRRGGHEGGEGGPTRS